MTSILIETLTGEEMWERTEDSAGEYIFHKKELTESVTDDSTGEPL
jgi:hypothetical protein